MKKLTRTLLIATAGLLWALSAAAQAPANNPGVMLQGFYWDSYKNGEYGCTKWSNLKSQAQEIAETFDMIWLPPSAKASGGDNGGNGYVPMTWSTQTGAWGSVSELKGLISTLKQYNPDIKVIADIVVNHKAGNNIIDLNNETFRFSDGTTKSYTMYEGNKKSRFICQDDEARDIYGWNPTGNPDQGYESLACEENGKKARSSSGAYCAARDLDHKNTELQGIISTYLTWLRKEIGYDGWRYDYCKGFLGGYVRTYNQAAGAYFSVGEYWDGDYNALTHWINDTGKTSNAFDFCLKYNGFNNGLASKNYSALAGYGSGSGLIGDATYKQYAVTFVDNHDTFRDDNNKFWGDWTLANAYIIAMPGTPCVFYPHWVKCKNDIKKMAAARKACGITNTSSASCKTENGAFRGEIKGSKGTLVCYIGSQGTCPSGFTKACGGTNWAYYTTGEVPPPPPGETQYYVRVNGKTNYPAEPTGEVDFQGREQFMAKVPLKAGDNITAYDKVNDAEFPIPDLDPYGAYQKFTASSTGVKCNTAGCYHVYIKLKFEDNLIYIEDATDCTTDADDIEGIDGVTLVPNPTSGEMTILSDKEFILGNVTTIGGKNCGSFEVNGNTIDVSRLAPNREPYLLRLVDSNGNVTVESFFRR